MIDVFNCDESQALDVRRSPHTFTEWPSEPVDWNLHSTMPCATFQSAEYKTLTEALHEHKLLYPVMWAACTTTIDFAVDAFHHILKQTHEWHFERHGGTPPEHSHDAIRWMLDGLVPFLHPAVIAVWYLSRVRRDFLERTDRSRPYVKACDNIENLFAGAMRTSMEFAGVEPRMRKDN